MQQVTLKQLLEAGVHFGHQTRRWNPKMRKYIFGEKNGIYIINLELTLGCLNKALEFLKKVAAEGKEILFVGTKKQAQDVIKEASERSRMPYVHNRWLGGMLTNFSTVRKSVARLDWIDQTEKEGNFKFITKKEAAHLVKEREKLTRYLAGVRRMKKLPGAVFIIDTKKEEIALHEAMKLGIPTIALIDTNCDPELVDYPVPGNDDAIRAIKLFCDLVAEAITEGRNEFLKLYPLTEEEMKEIHAQEEVSAPVAASETAAEITEEVTPTVETVPPVAVPIVEQIEEVIEDKIIAKTIEEETKTLKVKKAARVKEPKKPK
ncbi:MAG: 30S ribosomal protein S2 [Candidatus Omnitrophica bacterium]|nr:30S ribosomal protein S2 [Candidatus Omnitrophota bacterium]